MVFIIINLQDFDQQYLLDSKHKDMYTLEYIGPTKNTMDIVSFLNRVLFIEPLHPGKVYTGCFISSESEMFIAVAACFHRR